MDFEDKYISISDSELSPEEAEKKIIISNESFAICEMIQNLMIKIEHLRLK